MDFINNAILVHELQYTGHFFTRLDFPYYFIAVNFTAVKFLMQIQLFFSRKRKKNKK